MSNEEEKGLKLSAEKFEKALRIVLLFILAVSFVAFGLGQFSSYLGNLREAQTYSAEQEALAGCVEFGAPHAIVVNGEAWCYTIWYGSEQIILLKTLQEMYAPLPTETAS